MEPTISWRAPEHEHRAHSADWYWAMGIITVALAVALVIVGNILLAIIIVLGISILFVHTRHAPRIIECELSTQGVRVNSNLYAWSTLESFWILKENTERGGLLLLTSKKPLAPHIVVPLDDSHETDNLREILSHKLTEEEQAEPFPDRLMRKLGF